MSQSPQTELTGILFQEIESYLPEIDRTLQMFKESAFDQDTLNEVYRLFHNIKGAASQVAFTGLSKSAALCETVLSNLLEKSRLPAVAELEFLDEANSRIREFCKLDEKTKEAEASLVTDTFTKFRALVADSTPETVLDIPENVQNWLESDDQSSAIAQAQADIQEQMFEVRSETLSSLRSVLPLLQELAECSTSADRELAVEHISGLLTSAVSTLAQCLLTTGLYRQHKLLSGFLHILNKLRDTPSSFQQQTPALLVDFLTYLDLVFSLSPEESELIIAKNEDLFHSLGDILDSGISPPDNQVQVIEPVVDGLQNDLLDTPLSDEGNDFLFADLDDPALDDDFFALDEDLDQVLTGGKEHEVQDIPADEPADAPAVFPVDNYGNELSNLLMEESQEDALEQASDEAVIAAQLEMSDDELDLARIFKIECEEHLQVINQELITLETEVHTPLDITSQLRETIGRMRRAVHTLKGAAAMTGFDNLASCSHSLEDLLDWQHDEAGDILPADVAVIAEAIDTIEALSEANTPDAGIQASAITSTISSYLRLRMDQFADAATDPDEGTENILEDASQPDYVEDSSQTNSVTVGMADGPLHTEQTSLPSDTGNVRVRLDDLDELVSIEGELVVSRGYIEKLLEKFSNSLSEFNTIKDALKRKSQELEVGFEAQSLYGFGPGGAPGNQADTGDPQSSLSEFDPIELDRYSQLNLIIRSLNEISIDANAIYTEMTSLTDNIQGQIAKQQLAMGVMQEKLMRIRMTPLSAVSRLLFRTVRQTATRLEKDVRLTVTGEDVYMDRFVWSRIIDPLMHILRNCVDHGIEEEGVREELGKDPIGRITIDATQRGRLVLLRIQDDGKGIDTKLLREKLFHDGLIQATDSVSDEDLLPYLFRPSVSTRDDISEVSGRGVGLDVVLRNVQELRGSVKISNTHGQGVVFELSIPITLSVNRAIMISLGARQFAVPLQDIVEVRKYRDDDFINGEPQLVPWNDLNIRTINLAQQLNISNVDSPAQTDGGRLMLIVDNGTDYMALEIDKIDEQREIVIKDLGTHLRYVRGINGVTLTGDGTVIPILNLHEIGGMEQTSNMVVEQAPLAAALPKTLKVLIVDDSISVRHSISRLVESQAWQPYQAVDGLDALEKLETLTPDVIVLDIEMPRMNGYEFMNNLRLTDTKKDIPVVMLTSRASDKHRKKAQELGVDHYLTKPYQDEAFVELLESMSGQI